MKLHTQQCASKVSNIGTAPQQCARCSEAVSDHCDGRSATWCACAAGHLPCLRAVANATTVNQTDDQGWSPLFAAVNGNHADCVSLLIELGANVDYCRANGRTALFLAAQNGRSECVQILVAHGARFERVTTEGVTPLYLAAFNGHANCVDLLASFGANVNHTKASGCGPLWVASQNGHVDCIRALLARGAEIDLCNTNGCSPLYVAAYNGHAGCVTTLCQAGAAVNKTDTDGCSPIFVAAQGGHTKSVAVLLEHGADPTIPGLNATTPLFIAAENGHTDCILLLTPFGMIETADSKGDTPLGIAAHNGHLESIAALLQAGAPVHSLSAGRTALHAAANQGFADCVRLLLAHGADRFLRDQNNRLPVHVCALEVEPLLLPQERCDLFTAISSGDVDALTTVLESSEDTVALVNSEDRSGWTPLMEAVVQRKAECVPVLLAAGARPDHTDFAGMRAIAYGLSLLGGADVATLQALGGLTASPEEIESVKRLNATASQTPEGLIQHSNMDFAAASTTRAHRSGTAIAGLGERMADGIISTSGTSSELEHWIEGLRWIRLEPLANFLQRIGRSDAWVVRPQPPEENPPMPEVLAGARRWLARKVMSADYEEIIDAECMATIYVYTMASDLYRIPNRGLRNSDISQLNTWRPFVAHLSRSLSLLRREYNGDCPYVAKNEWVFRGIAVCVHTTLPAYPVGTVVVWNAFSSSSLKWKVAKGFVGSTDDAEGIVFAILSRTGLRIDRWSFYPEELEVLFAPGTSFRVNGYSRACQDTLDTPQCRSWKRYKLNLDEALLERAVVVEMEECEPSNVEQPQ